jgi:hypothetical protein
LFGDVFGASIWLSEWPFLSAVTRAAWRYRYCRWPQRTGRDRGRRGHVFC